MYFLDKNKEKNGWIQRLFYLYQILFLQKRFEKFQNLFIVLQWIWCVHSFGWRKNKFSFTCSFCNSLNQLGFNTICNEYTVRLLKNAAIDRQIEEKINEILQINLMKLKMQES